MGADISYVNPENLRYTKSTIPPHFDNETSLESTYKAILDGTLDIDSLPPVEIVQEKLWYTPFLFSPNLWVTDGNRRLFIYKKLKVLGAVSTVRVKQLEYGDRGPPQLAFSTRNDGQMVDIPSEPGLAEKFNTIGLLWQENVEARDRFLYRLVLGSAVASSAITIIYALWRGRIIGA